MNVLNPEQGHERYSDTDVWNDIHALSRAAMKAFAHTAVTYNGQVEVNWDAQHDGATYELSEERNDLGSRYFLAKRELLGETVATYEYRPAMMSMKRTGVQNQMAPVFNAEILVDTLLTSELDLSAARQLYVQDMAAAKRMYSIKHHPRSMNALFEQLAREV